VHRILDPRGALAHYLWESIPYYGTYFEEIEVRPDMRILDVGCGVGRTTLELASMVPEGKVVGIDINPALTACANQLAQLFDLGLASGSLRETLWKKERFQKTRCSTSFTADMS